MRAGPVSPTRISRMHASIPSSTAIRALLHEFVVARAYSEALIAPLDPDQIAWRPHEHSSAIGWHLGHQAAVAHYLVRNLTAAEPSIDPELDRLFDSATPEPQRGDLPPLDATLDYRIRSAQFVDRAIGRIVDGDVGAPEQLRLIADGVMRAVIHHEYQHATWIREVRDNFTDVASPTPDSGRLRMIEGYHVLGTSG